MMSLRRELITSDWTRPGVCALHRTMTSEIKSQFKDVIDDDGFNDPKDLWKRIKRNSMRSDWITAI